MVFESVVFANLHYIFCPSDLLFIRVVLRGDKDDHAVLCTKDRTFDLKGAELSNSMLLLRHLDYGPDLPASGPQEMQEREVCVHMCVCMRACVCRGGFNQHVLEL